jgi:hypothetical protein
MGKEIRSNEREKKSFFCIFNKVPRTAQNLSSCTSEEIEELKFVFNFKYLANCAVHSFMHCPSTDLKAYVNQAFIFLGCM